MGVYGQAKWRVLDALRFSAKADKGEMTAYGIAKASGYSPQHINRVLAKMWHEGDVAYVDSVGRNGKACRRWTTTGRAKKRRADGWNINPHALRQMELGI